MAKIKITIEKEGLEQNIVVKSKKEKIQDTINAVIDRIIEKYDVHPSIAYGMVIGTLTTVFKVKKIKNSDEEFKIIVKSPETNAVIEILIAYADALGIDISDEKEFNDEDEEYYNDSENEYDEYDEEDEY